MISSFTRPKTVENNYQWYLNPILFNKNKTLLEFGTYCIIRIRPPQTDFVHRSSLTASIDQGLVWKKHFWFLGSKTLFGIFSLRISHSINCIRIWLITVISPESTSKETRVRCNVSWPIWMVVSLGCPNLLSQTFWLILSAPFDRKRQKIITVVVVEKRTMWSLNVQTIQQNSWFSTKLFRDMTPKVEALMTPRGLNFHFDILWLDKIQPGLHGVARTDCFQSVRQFTSTVETSSLFRMKKSFLSGIFKAKYRGIYQFSVAIQFEGHSTYEYELVRGNRGGGTQVLALGKSSNSEVDFKLLAQARTMIG